MVKRGVALLFLLVLTAGFATSQSHSVAITVDDMPAVIYETDARGTAEALDINRKLLAAFQRHHVPATGFVNQQKVEEDEQTKAREAILDLWLKAGLTLGNHTYSHMKFSKASLAEFEQNTVDGERSLKPLLAKHGQKLRFFRFPYNDTGGTVEQKAAFAKFLAERGYEVATCTMENSDWVYSSIYADAKKRGDVKHAAEIRAAYLEFSGLAFDGYSKMAREVIGRDFPQVLVIHANHLNAEAIDDLLTLFEKRGYKFVSLTDAQADPAYKTPDIYVGPYGWMWQQRWAKGLGIKPDPRDAPDPPKWVEEEYEKVTKVGY